MHDYCNNLFIFFLGGAVLDHLFNNCHIKNKFCSSSLLLIYLQSNMIKLMIEAIRYRQTD